MVVRRRRREEVGFEVHGGRGGGGEEWVFGIGENQTGLKEEE